MRYRGGDAEIDTAVGRGDFDRAIRLLKLELERRPGNPRLAQKLADVLVRAGHREQAANICCALAEAYAEDGFTAKAIATLKKVQSIDGRRPEAERRLAELILRRDRELRESAPEEQPAAPRTLPVRSPLFSGIGIEELVAAIGGLELETFAPGEIIFSEGESGDSLYVLAGGSASIFVKGGSGRNSKVRTLSDGDFFGEIAFVTGGPRTATVTAAVECEVLKLEQAAVSALEERFPGIGVVIRDFARMRSGSPEELEARLRASDPPIPVGEEE